MILACADGGLLCGPLVATGVAALAAWLATRPKPDPEDRSEQTDWTA